MTEYDIKKILFGAKFLFGPNGENWFSRTKQTGLCVLTAVWVSARKLGFIDREAWAVINPYLNTVLKDLGHEFPSIISFNDNVKTTWADIDELFTVAIDRIKPLQVSE